MPDVVASCSRHRLAPPRSEHALSNNLRRKISKRGQRGYQRHMNLIGKPCASPGCIQHLDRIGSEACRIFALDRWRQRVYIRCIQFSRRFCCPEVRRWRSFSYRFSALLKNRFDSTADSRSSQVSHDPPVSSSHRDGPNQSDLVAFTRRVQIDGWLRQLQRRGQRRANRRAPAQPSANQRHQ